MSRNKEPIRWLLMASHLGTIVFLTACAIFGAAQPTDNGLFQFDDGNIQIQDENGDWVQVNGTSFELTGTLDSIDPWIVSGTALEVSEATSIEEGLEPGDLVIVHGAILDDGTWVAYSIESTDLESDPIIVLIGVVDSVDPWSVAGIELDVTEETDVQGEITPGMIVRVEILPQPDGTWNVISIAPLAESSETSGCVTVIATVVSVEGNEIQFLGWPVTVILDTSGQTDNDNQDDENLNNNDNEADEDEGDEDESEGDEQGDDIETDDEETDISPGQDVMAVICVSEDGTLIVVQITVLPTGSDTDTTGEGGGEKVQVCHNLLKNPHTLSISSSAVPAHLGHGDTLGACP